MAATSSVKKGSKRLYIFIGVGLALIVLNFAVPRLFFSSGSDKPFAPARRATPTTQPVAAGDGTGAPVGPAQRDPFQPI